MESEVPGVTVREARVADLPAIVEMARELAAAVEDPPPPIDAPFLESMLVGENRWSDCFIAIEADEPLGYVVANRYFEPHTGMRRLIIADLYVAKRGRKRGIGLQLFAAVVQRAGALRCHEITWEIWNQNATAFAFYEKLGGRPVLDVSLMRLRLQST